MYYHIFYYLNKNNTGINNQLKQFINLFLF